MKPVGLANSRISTGYAQKSPGSLVWCWNNFKETVAGHIKSTIPLQRQLSASVPQVQEPSTIRTYVVRHLKALYLEGPGQLGRHRRVRTSLKAHTTVRSDD
jgi:hypothetical protein